jgi:hypothetical protein
VSAVAGSTATDPVAPTQRDPAPSACGIQTTDRIVAIGDVHGAHDRFVAILREAGVIDQRQRWTGGKAVLVQTGDVVDRGADSRKALDLIRRLETDAPKAGGRVVALLGNHEVLRMLGDTRYVSEGEYAAFRSPDATDLRERYYTLVSDAEKANAAKTGQKFDERPFRQSFLERTPLGLVEMQLAFAGDGEYGRWLRTHDAIAIVNGIAFLHGGTTLSVATQGCAAVNATVRTQLQTMKLSDPGIEQSLIASPTGPLWYRGLVDQPPAVDAAAFDTILQTLGVKSMVVGHTVAPGGKIRASFDGRLVQIDTGMLGQKFYPDGAPSALEIRDGKFTAIYLGAREVIAGPPAPAHSAHR